jgi:hypothetical protein
MPNIRIIQPTTREGTPIFNTFSRHVGEVFFTKFTHCSDMGATGEDVACSTCPGYIHVPWSKGITNYVCPGFNGRLGYELVDAETPKSFNIKDFIIKEEE